MLLLLLLLRLVELEFDERDDDVHRVWVDYKRERGVRENQFGLGWFVFLVRKGKDEKENGDGEEVNTDKRRQKKEKNVVFSSVLCRMKREKTK